MPGCICFKSRHTLRKTAKTCQLVIFNASDFHICMWLDAFQFILLGTWVLWQMKAPQIIPKYRNIWRNKALLKEKTTFLEVAYTWKCFTIEILLKVKKLTVYLIHRVVFQFPNQLLYCKMLMHNFFALECSGWLSKILVKIYRVSTHFHCI